MRKTIRQKNIFLLLYRQHKTNIQHKGIEHETQHHACAKQRTCTTCTERTLHHLKNPVFQWHRHFSVFRACEHQWQRNHLARPRHDFAHWPTQTSRHRDFDFADGLWCGRAFCDRQIQRLGQQHDFQRRQSLGLDFGHHVFDQYRTRVGDGKRHVAIFV